MAAPAVYRPSLRDGAGEDRNRWEGARGWGETKESSLADFATPTDELWLRNVNMAQDFVSSVTAHYSGGRGYHSSFWQRTYCICASLLEDRGQLDSNREPGRAVLTFNSITWTNVFKIGTRDGNPDRQMADLLLSHGPHLRAELERLRPNVVVFSTGHGYDEYLSRAGFTITPVSTNLATVSGAATSFAARAPHFQWQSNRDLAELYQCLEAIQTTTRCRLGGAVENVDPNRETPETPAERKR